MAMITNSVTNISTTAAQTVPSNIPPQFSSPWSQIVIGECDPASAVPPQQAMASAEEECPDNAYATDGSANRRPAWNKPSNGALETGHVMGAVSWPALSESAKVSPKLASDSPKGFTDGQSSTFIPQGTGAAVSSVQKGTGNDGNPNPSANHAVPTRQRSFKRNGGATFEGGSSQSPGSHGIASELFVNNPSPKDYGHRNPQYRGANDAYQPRGSFRNRGGGVHGRGDGSPHHNYAARRDQDRGNQEWNAPRNFPGRDVHMQPQRGVPRFMRHPAPSPPSSAAAFMAPTPLCPYAPLGFPEMPAPIYYVTAPPPDSFRGMPYVAAQMPPHAVYFPAPDLQLYCKIVNQIDYYFSNENLVKDTYLRQNMDDQGWVPIKLIAGFNKVMQLTDNIQIILDALKSSTVVETQADKIRKRADWMRWIIKPIQFSDGPVPHSPKMPAQDALANSLKGVSLKETSSNNDTRTVTESAAETCIARTTSGDPNTGNTQPQGTETAATAGTHARVADSPV